MTGALIEKSALQRLLEAIGGDTEDLKDFIQEFVETTPDQIQKMRKACDEGDITALRIAAHSLKSNAKDFGATSLASQCEILEQQCQNSSVTDAATQVADIHTSLLAASESLLTIEL